MKLYCNLTGVEVQISTFAYNLKISGQHPLIGAPLKVLLSRAADWHAGRLDVTECRVLFVALLHSTGMCEFKVAATPEHKTVQQNMELMFRIAQWYDVVGRGLKYPMKNSRGELEYRSPLPTFVVNHATHKLENVRMWLEAWQNIEQDWKDDFRYRTLREKLEPKERALERLIKSATKRTENFAGQLITWAMDATGIKNEDTRAYWKELFTMRDLPSICNARTVDLEEMEDHFVGHLEHGTIYAARTLQHCRKLLKINKEGMIMHLGGVDPENPYNFAEDDIETNNREAAASMAPIEEPKKDEYQSLVAYLTAKAAWISARSIREKADANEKEQELQLKVDELDNITAGETIGLDDEISTVVDGLALTLDEDE